MIYSLEEEQAEFGKQCLKQIKEFVCNAVAYCEMLPGFYHLDFSDSGTDKTIEEIYARYLNPIVFYLIQNKTYIENFRELSFSETDNLFYCSLLEKADNPIVKEFYNVYCATILEDIEPEEEQTNVVVVPLEYFLSLLQ